MIMLKKVRLIDPASRTDGIRDILISEGKITKIGEGAFRKCTLLLVLP